MKIDELSQYAAFSDKLSGASGADSGGQEFAGKLLRAMALKNSQPSFAAPASAGNTNAKTSGTVQRGFGYIMPVISKNASQTDKASQFAENGGYFDMNDPLFSGSNGANVLSQYAPYFSSAMLGQYGSAGYGSGYGIQQPTIITSSEVTQEARANRAVMDSFNVQFNPRYFPRVDELGNRSTYCNRYVNDVTRALGTPVQGGNANGIHGWLSSPAGAQDGWTEVTADQAQSLVNRGYVGVAAWKNPYGHGHVQMISPSADGAYSPEKGVAISQAGRLLINYGYMTDVYRDTRIPEVRYFVKLRQSAQVAAENADIGVIEDAAPGEIEAGDTNE